jgi:hypothetical protein
MAQTWVRYRALSLKFQVKNGIGKGYVPSTSVPLVYTIPANALNAAHFSSPSDEETPCRIAGVIERKSTFILFHDSGSKFFLCLKL